MPFAVWCTTCPKPTIIGQGVRFNAEKKKVGNYYSTPIYSFHMKHTACGGIIEIRTDPQNTAYVVTEGGKKRDTGDDKELEDEVTIRTEEEKERLRNDAFAALEGKVEDKRKADVDSRRIQELESLRERDWADPYVGSQKLRRAFRVERKVREKNDEASEALKDKMSLGIDLLEETEEDRMRARLIDFGDLGEAAIEKAKIRPLFANDRDARLAKSETRKHNHRKKKARHSATDDTAKKKALLCKEIRVNTLAAIDPFITSGQISRPATGRLLPIVKRKRQSDLPASSDCDTIKHDPNTSGSGNLMESKEPSSTPFEHSPALVDYGSD